MSHLAALVGLASEARCLDRAARRHGARVTVAASGAVPDRAQAAARRLVAARPDVLVSFGLAGGLDPALAAGELVCPEQIHPARADAAPMAAQPDPAWRAWAIAALSGQVAGGTLVAAEAAVTTPAAKAALAAAGGGIVDMETAALAEAAADSGTPLLVLRAVCDPAAREVPAALLALLDADGRLRWRSLPAALRDLPAALPLAMDSRRAHRSLRQAAEALCRAAAVQAPPPAADRPSSS